jgi:hypothetical protein
VNCGEGLQRGGHSPLFNRGEGRYRTVGAVSNSSRPSRLIVAVCLGLPYGAAHVPVSESKMTSLRSRSGLLRTRRHEV